MPSENFNTYAVYPLLTCEMVALISTISVKVGTNLTMFDGFLCRN